VSALTAKRCAAICGVVLTLGACQTAQNGGEALTGAPRAQKTASQPQPETPRSAGSVPAYSRDAFGSGWTDPDRNGCDARQDAVARATTNRVYDGKCRIVVADVFDRYTGRTYRQAKTSTFDIDHIVAEHDAWLSGAASWTRARRIAFANDPADLVLTTASANRSKGDQDPSTWAPASHDGACFYVRTYRAIKLRWRLHTTTAQRSAIRRTLTTCTGTEGR
jgi:hypothetical protein